MSYQLGDFYMKRYNSEHLYIQVHCTNLPLHLKLDGICSLFIYLSLDL